MQLRQNKNRWLLIGNDNSNYEASFLSLDRMLNCNISDIEYNSKKFDVNKYFEEMIGVSIPETEEPLEIKLWFSTKQAKYAFSKPIHPSLTKIKETKTGTQALLIVKPNYELYQWLLGMGNAVKVLSPKSVQTELVKRLQASIVHYK